MNKDLDKNMKMIKNKTENMLNRIRIRNNNGSNRIRMKIKIRQILIRIRILKIRKRIWIRKKHFL